MRRSVTPSLRCPDCRLHRPDCLCSELPVVPTRTRLVLVMHQSEAWKSSNTGRLALRCLPNSLIVAHGRLAPDACGERPIIAEPPYPWQGADGPFVVLAPDADARPIDEWRGGDAVTLVVPDGTWGQAARARRRFPGLADLPTAIVPAGPARYRLRYDPNPERLGTMEAVARALGALEGAEVQAALEHVLRLMVERTLITRGRKTLGPRSPRRRA
jgi:DTW domain-containing protein